MSLEDLVRQWFAVWESGDFENIPVSEDFRHTSPYGTVEGKAAYLDLVKANKDKFLGYHFEIHDILHGKDKTCTWYTAVQGDFRLDVSEWHYVRDGLIYRIVAHYNISGVVPDDRKLKNDEALKQSSRMITVQAIVQAPVDKVWEFWTAPEHIVHWNAASADWHTIHAVNDLRPGGRFVARMEARDGSMGFDFGGVYQEVEEHRLIAYTLDDGRAVQIEFHPAKGGIQVTERFEPESTHDHATQQAGWQAILDNFKRYVEVT